MSPSNKGRRGPGSTTGPANVFQGGSPRRDAPSSSTSSARKDVIAPPPRVQLNSSSSPSPEDPQSSRRSRRGSNTPSVRSLPPSTVSSATATNETIKEKDARIASLERELDKILANESETAWFWQAKHAALNQQFLRTDEELRMVREELRAREAEAEELTSGWRDAMRMEMTGRDEEIRGLKAQVRGLKEWVSTSTRADGTASTSDEVFGEGWARLGNGLQNWMISNFRRAKIDLARADEAARQELAELVPMYEELAQSHKVHLLQSIVSRILAQRVFGAYFVGLSAEQEEHLRQAENLVASFGSVEFVNQWRSVTLSAMKKASAEHMQSQTAQTTENLVVKVNRMLNAITTDPAGKSSGSNTTMPGAEARDQALRQLISSAIELSRLLVVQKAVFEVWMPEIVPHQQVIFDHNTMEDIGGEDEESLSQREICCVTFPGVIKRGDGNGAQLRFTNVISRARVLCSPE